jgi:hypothetical protein
MAAFHRHARNASELARHLHRRTLGVTDLGVRGPIAAAGADRSMRGFANGGDGKSNGKGGDDVKVIGGEKKHGSG